MIVLAKFEFSPQYPFEPPQLKFEQVKGLDDDQIDNVFKSIEKELEILSNQRKENDDDNGLIFDVHEIIR